jgi:hypothetical protein
VILQGKKNQNPGLEKMKALVGFQLCQPHVYLFGYSLKQTNKDSRLLEFIGRNFSDN